MSKKIIYVNANQKVSVVHPMPEMFEPNSRTRINLRSNGMDFDNEEEVLAYIIQKDLPPNTQYKIVDETEIPSDRYFRDAWDIDFENETVTVNTDAAIEIQKDVLRQKRAPLLQKLDVEFMKALEQSESTTEIVNKKQQLRDITALEFPTDLEELKNFIPEILTEG